MVRPCVASGLCRAGGKRSRINVSGLRLELLLRTIMDISARAISLTDRPQRAIWVTSVRTRSEDRTSISSHPLADLGWKLLIGLRHRSLLICAVPLFEPKAVPSSRPAERRSRRAQGRSRPAVGLGLRLAPALPGCALTASSTAARIKRVGRLHRRSSSARRRVPWPAPPRRCGQVCWRARSRARCGANASWRLQSRI